MTTPSAPKPSPFKEKWRKPIVGETVFITDRVLTRNNGAERCAGYYGIIRRIELIYCVLDIKDVRDFMGYSQWCIYIDDFDLLPEKNKDVLQFLKK